MKRIIVMVLRYFYIAPYWFLKLARYARSDKKTEQEKYAYLRFFTEHANKGGRVLIDVHGVENLPKENGYVMFPNHQGLFDVLAIIEANPVPFSFVIKKEAANNFFLKTIISLLKAQVIDREDIRQSMKVIMAMSKEVKEGRNYLIFPEGTRSKNNQLLDFKGGSFKSAMNAKAPIVPVALVDAYKAFDTSSIKKLTVQVHFLKPLYYEDYKDMKSNEIAKFVHDQIQSKIDYLV